MKFRFSKFVTSLGILTIALFLHTVAPPVSSSESELISLADFFVIPDRTQVTLSPDGRQIAFIGNRDGTPNLAVVAINTPLDTVFVTSETGRGIASFVWSGDGKYLLFFKDAVGAENFQLFRLDPSNGEQLQLTNFPDAQTEIVKVSSSRPDMIAVRINSRDPSWRDLFLINLETADLSEIDRNTNQFYAYTLDQDLFPKFALSQVPGGGAQLFEKDEDGWQAIKSLTQDDASSFSVIRLTSDGSKMYFISTEGRDKRSLFALDRETHEETLVYEHTGSNLWDNHLADTETGEIRALWIDYLRSGYVTLSDDLVEEINYLESNLRGDIIINGRSADGTKWLVMESSPDVSDKYHVFDATLMELKFLFRSAPAMDELPLSPKYAVEIPSRDGKTLVSYLTLPIGTDLDGDGVPEKPLPLIVNPHGGPGARDSFIFSRQDHWLANRGYAVLKVNYRGSAGFGKEFQNSARQKWNTDVLNDLVDGADWAVERGIANPDKMAIMGGSAGGYLTLIGMTFAPDVFACGVDLFGMSNLITTVELIDPKLTEVYEMLVDIYGDPKTDDGRQILRSQSPLFYASNIKNPLLVLQGVNDPRVLKIESDQIVDAAKANGVAISYVVFPDEGHGWRKPENNLAANAVIERFLASCLGGRYLPWPSAALSSSITIPVGSTHIPDLPEQIISTE